MNLYSRLNLKFPIWSHAKAPRLIDRKQVNIRNMDVLTIGQARELWRGPNGKF